MAGSIDSERPILAPHTGNSTPNRFSTYSKTTSDDAALASYDYNTRDLEIGRYREQVRRMEAAAMDKQRYQLTESKLDEQSKLALVRKVERSLERRYHNQDAVMKPKKDLKSEKQ